MRMIKDVAILTFSCAVGYRIGMYCADRVSNVAGYLRDKVMLELDKKTPVKDVMVEMKDVNTRANALREGKRLIRKEQIKDKVELGFH